MDIEKEVNDRLSGYINSDKFTQHIDDVAERLVNDVLESLFRYGAVRETIKKALEERVAVNVDQIDFPHINQIITMMVKEKTAKAFSEPLREKLGKELDDMFAPAPKEITVQGIVDLLREETKEDDGCGCADPEKDMELEIKLHDRNSGASLKLWAEDRYTKDYSGGKRENSPTLHMYVRQDGSIAIIHDLHLKRNFATGVYGFDAKLFMMYCGGTKITDILTADPDHLNLRINDHLDY